MPEQLLGRIIRACSHEGELVLDPFGGSGTTLAVAKKLKRHYLGFELSSEYAARIEARLNTITPGDPLDGAAEPLISAPTTANGRKLEHVKPAKRPRTKSSRAK
jgi:site-specific DNA-methyltransferase (adenine-specific)